MASFQVVRGVNVTSFQNSEQIYVHCVSEVDFHLTLVDLPCLQLVCREIHISFIDKMEERRVALALGWQRVFYSAFHR